MVDTEALRTLIEEERQRFGVPGTAVAVVADGEVVLCEGFGIRDLAAGEPTTSETHFPIASDTKCFTAAMVCLLADQGLIDLDAPVRQVLPWFEMHDPHATALVSARDLLSHRTGLPRHDFVWYGKTQLTMEEIVRRLRHLPLSRQLRQTWQYNNLCFTTAGYITEVLAGQPWPDAVRARLLGPIGMSHTVFSVEAPEIKALAMPYKLVGDALELQALPEKDRLLPAGGIVSTAEDMAKWLQARVGGCPEVLSDDALKQLHAPTMIGGVGGTEFAERQPMGYALGCQVESYRGRRLIRHGGNLVGYSSDVCVVPDAKVGVAVLTNMHGTSLRDALPLAIVDRLLGFEPAPWGERFHELMTAALKGREEALEHHEARAGGQPPSRPLADFLGDYEHPAYGTFTIAGDGDKLVPDFHGLAERIELRHRDHDVWDVFLVEFDTALPLIFQQGPDGAIASFTVPFEGMVEPIRFVRALPPVDPALLDAMPGEYEMGPHKLTVRRRGSELVVQVPGAGALKLQAAGARRFVSPTMSTVVIEATVDDSGAVTQLTVDPIGIFVRTQ